jgi:MFS family permease
VLYASAALGILAIRTRTEPARREKTTWRTVSAGLRFISTQKVLLGAVTLDMLAVCLGGVTALLPIFSDALGASVWGSGLLRSAQAVGALCMASAIAMAPVRRRAGVKLLWSVAAYGVAILCFGLSTNIYMAVVALFVSGAADQMSVFIRQTIMQSDTPDAMRGRVSALNVIFIGATTSLGEFESGLLASLVGAGPAVLIGGAGAILCAGLWSLLFPALRKRDELTPPKPAREEPA